MSDSANVYLCYCVFMIRRCCAVIVNVWGLATVHDQIEKFLCIYKSSNMILKDILYFATVKGDEVSLQKALNIVHMNSHEYVAVLFYASWCSFSKTFRPSFSIMSSLYPSIPHFAIEESAIRPRFVSH
jgi:thiol-disulfide isomerase/thioredoxin